MLNCFASVLADDKLRKPIMIASLMMYARPELADAHGRFWQLIRHELDAVGIDAPEQLDQDAYGVGVWKSPELVLSQTCGMPFRLWLSDAVTLVGTPDYDLDECPAGYYRSPLVVRARDTRSALSDFKEAVFAFNQTHSQSGYAAPYAHVEPFGFWFDNEVETGSHLASAKAVAEGRADIAALDAVTWRLIKRYESCASNLRVLEWTKPTPGLPLITANGRDAEAMFDAINCAIDALSEKDKEGIGIQRIVKIPKENYLAVPNPPM